MNLAPKNMHSHAIPGVAEWVHRQNHAGWYQRVDNNGWRPLAQHVLVRPATACCQGAWTCGHGMNLEDRSSPNTSRGGEGAECLLATLTRRFGMEVYHTVIT